MPSKILVLLLFHSFSAVMCFILLFVYLTCYYVRKIFLLFWILRMGNFRWIRFFFLLLLLLRLLNPYAVVVVFIPFLLLLLFLIISFFGISFYSLFWFGCCCCFCCLLVFFFYTFNSTFTCDTVICFNIIYIYPLGHSTHFQLPWTF